MAKWIHQRRRTPATADPRLNARPAWPILLGLAAVLLFGTDLPGQRPADVDAAEAHRHVGETRTVCGEVVGTHHDPNSEGGPTFLNLGRPHPRQVFTVVIWRRDREKFQRPPEHYYADRRICVTGPITLRGDVPRITVGDPSQIQVVRKSGDRPDAPDPEAPPSTPPVTVCHWDAVRESITLCTDRQEPVDLGGWILTDGEGTYVIPPGETVTHDQDWTVTIQTYNPRRATQRLMLNNRSDQILLRDPQQNLVDEVAW